MEAFPSRFTAGNSFPAGRLSIQDCRHGLAKAMTRHVLRFGCVGLASRPTPNFFFLPRRITDVTMR